MVLSSAINVSPPTKVIAESVTERIYPTEYEPPSLPCSPPMLEKPPGTAIEWLADREVVLLGVDVPSVDRIASKDLPNHHALYRAGIHILEGLELDAAPVGPCELVALPLRLRGADASPVRAVIRTDGRLSEKHGTRENAKVL